MRQDFYVPALRLIGAALICLLLQLQPNPSSFLRFDSYIRAMRLVDRYLLPAFSAKAVVNQDDLINRYEIDRIINSVVVVMSHKAPNGG